VGAAAALRPFRLVRTAVAGDEIISGMFGTWTGNAVEPQAWCMWVGALCER